ncbi:MAG TPA: mannosyltransferase family protein, partial [Solirubrobacteraceae bacterium]|nr:mannosyltransferase family protein [Solirubrobacteraceae bacterium]
DALRRLRADPERMTAIRDSWRALWSSRLLVWVAGVATIVALGWGPPRKAFDPPGVTKGFGWLGDLLAAPAARWDSAWYLVIARFGYRPDLGVYTRSREAFFPLYPLGIRGGTALGLPPIAAGVLISTAALALALYGIHRLTTLELRSLAPAGVRPGEVARLAVLLMAFAPMAFYLSAVYSESLYLALSVGLFLCARSGKWAWVGVFGALATATRSTGLVLLVPALWLYLYGPREDLVPLARAGLGPRFALRRDVLWLALIPAGAVAYGVYLGLSGGDFLTPVHSQDAWGRHFAGPYVGVWDGLRAALDGARQLLSGQQHHVYFAAPGSAFVSAEHNILLFVFLAAGLAAFIGVARRLPAAYALYVLAALAVPLSYPVGSQPLMSMPRFLMVLFPMAIWLAMWLSERPRAVRPVLVLSACSMVFFLADFATWHWVA